MSSSTGSSPDERRRTSSLAAATIPARLSCRGCRTRAWWSVELIGIDHRPQLTRCDTRRTFALVAVALSRLTAAVLVCAAALAFVPAAQARPASAGKDGRPNILVVMTDDMAAADVKHM